MSAAAAKHGETFELAHAMTRLCEILHPGSTVYSVLRRRAKQRQALDFYAIDHGRVVGITKEVVIILGLPTNKAGNALVTGWGPDAAWHTVHNLSFALHGLVGKGAGKDPAAACDVADAENYRAGHSLRQVWL